NSIFTTAGIKGGALFFVGATTLTLLFSKYSSKAKYMRLPTKAFFISSMTTAGFVVFGEHALIEYDRKSHAHLVPDYLQDEEKVVDTTPLTSTQKFQDFVADYRYHLLGASWVIGMTGAGIYLYRKKYLTVQQKLVEARMYAQGITLASLGAVAA
ncbi:hypothetical protein K502DRAFT_282731, partial [Neoconidiobolus thromboides FSU 785]